MIAYRKDIDGLRALAVVPVVLFHAGISGFSGGFVGVDIFFVISGYLITSSLLGDLDKGNYSIARFYERRIRRIIPALIFMVAVVAAAGAVMQLPADLAELGTSIVSTLLFASNISFWINSGDYFGVGSEFQPLLHTWSLSVEEQFYIVFPLALAAIVRFGRRSLLPLLFALALLASLGLSIIGTENFKVATFYLLPTRAWELLAGSLLTVGLFTLPIGRWRAEGEGAIGLALILVPIFLYDSLPPSPGATAIPPVLGAFLVIHSGMGERSTLVGRLLSHPVPRFIGLISYSLYLWHWPIIVLTRYYLIELSLFDRFMIIVASFIAAVLSWRFIERPWRGRDAVLTRRPLFAATACTLVAGSAVGVLFARDGLPQRVPQNVVLMADKKAYRNDDRACGRGFERRASLESLCTRGAKGAQPDMLVVGDSHAEALASAAFEAAEAVGRSGYQLTDLGYRPVLGFRKHGEEEKYAYLNQLLTRLLAERPAIQDVIVAMYWHQAVNLDSYYNEGGAKVSGAQGVAKGLRELISRYPDKNFLLVLSPAHSLAFGGNAAARATLFGHEPFKPAVERVFFDAEERGYSAIVDSLASSDQRVAVVRLSDYLCDDVHCYGKLKDGEIAYSDDNHLSYAGSKLLDAAFQQFLSPSNRKQTTLATAEEK